MEVVVQTMRQFIKLLEESKDMKSFCLRGRYLFSEKMCKDLLAAERCELAKAARARSHLAGERSQSMAGSSLEEHEAKRPRLAPQSSLASTMSTNSEPPRGEKDEAWDGYD